MSGSATVDQLQHTTSARSVPGGNCQTVDFCDKTEHLNRIIKSIYYNVIKSITSA